MRNEPERTLHSHWHRRALKFKQHRAAFWEFLFGPVPEQWRSVVFTLVVVLPFGGTIFGLFVLVWRVWKGQYMRRLWKWMFVVPLVAALGGCSDTPEELRKKKDQGWDEKTGFAAPNAKAWADKAGYGRAQVECVVLYASGQASNALPCTVFVNPPIALECREDMLTGCRLKGVGSFR